MLIEEINTFYNNNKKYMKQLFLCLVFKISSFGQLEIDEIYLHKIQKSIVYCDIGECDYAYDEVSNMFSEEGPT